MLGLSEYISSVIKSISRIILCLATSQETCENGSNIGLNGQFVPVVVVHGGGGGGPEHATHRPTSCAGLGCWYVAAVLEASQECQVSSQESVNSSKCRSSKASQGYYRICCLQLYQCTPYGNISSGCWWRGIEASGVRLSSGWCTGDMLQ